MNATQTKQSFDTLNAAMADARAQYEKRYADNIRPSVTAVLAALAAAGWNRDEVAPRPHGRMSRKEYRMAQAKIAFISKWTKPTQSCRSPQDPYIVTLKDDVDLLVAAEAKKMATGDFDAYVYKLARKIGKAVVDAALTGYLWDYSTLTVKCDDGECQSWRTKIILNVSCLGKVFNQYPTRRC